MSDLEKIDQHEIPDDPKEIRLFAVVQNESLRLPYLIQYYQDLGVDRFFIIDNKSTDNTHELLLPMDNVHIFYTEQGFGGKKSWKNQLLRKYGDEHWCVIVDADELLIYPDYENRDLKELCSFMEFEGSNVLRSFLLDMYSVLDLKDAIIKPNQDPINIIDHFDSDVMKIGLTHDFNSPWKKSYRADGAPLVHGGMRRRTIGHSALLSKTCLFKYDKSMDVMVGHHLIKGRSIRSSSMRTVVLHTKYSADFVEVVEREASRGVYWNGGQEYKMFRSAGVSSNPKYTFKGECSLKFEGSQQLINLGFMKDNPLFHYKGVFDLPVYDNHKEELKTSIIRNQEKVKVLIDTIKNNNFKNIVDTSLNGGYNSCIMLNNCRDGNVLAIAENKIHDEMATTALDYCFSNFEAKVFENNIDGILQLHERIDFCFLDGISGYSEMKKALDHLIPLISKDGMILINNSQHDSIAAVISNTNWDGFTKIGCRTGNQFPLVLMSRIEDTAYVSEVDKHEHTKYIGIGLSESGFDSVRPIFETLGFQVQSFLLPNQMHRIEYSDYIDNLPMCNVFKEMDNTYNAKFIYTKIDIDIWLEKCKAHWTKYSHTSITKTMRSYRLETYGTDVFDEAIFRDKYIEHDRHVMEYFKDRPEKLLTIDFSKSKDENITKKIISFVGVDNLPE